MISVRILGATRTLKNTMGKGITHVRDETVAGVPYVTTLWEPTPTEIDDLKRGGHVKVSVLGDEYRHTLVAVEPYGD